MRLAVMQNDDLALVKSAVRGQRRAKRVVVDRLLERVRAMVGYLVGNDQDAEDMLQTTMLEILRALPGYDGRGRLESWADRITVRTCMRLLKRRSRRPDVGFLDENDLAEPGRLPRARRRPGGWEEGSVEERVAQHQIRRRMTVLLQQLPPRRRSVVALRWVFDYSPPEIAELTDTSVNTVRDHLQKGKHQLRKLIVDDPVIGEWAAEGIR